MFEKKDKRVEFYRVGLGCDPEFFFSKKGMVFGAEKILPKEGLEYKPSTAQYDGAHTSIGTTKSVFVIDGVQAELNPRPNSCRANLGNEISACFRELYSKLEKEEGININFSQVVEITEKELQSLSKKAREFGCAPSNNIYSGGETKITVNPVEYRYRSAGGHIHLGDNRQEVIKTILQKPEIVIPILDIVLGNTCVLIDKNPGNIERRKVYGRAGEFRQPKHGLEYRTLSNFWLQSYQLMSFVMGMARFAVCVSISGRHKELTKLVNMDDITNAINNNDYELAYKNFKKVEDKIVEMAGDYTDSHPISKLTIKQFHHFIKKSLNFWFKEDPLKHWINLPEGHGIGWESFCSTKVSEDMKTN